MGTAYKPTEDFLPRFGREKVKISSGFSLELVCLLGELKDPEILRMFWKEELNPVFKDASYIILLETACTEYPFIFYGEDLGIGGKVGFTVHRLKRLADIFRLPFDRSTAFNVYDDFARRKIVRAVPRVKRKREYTLYTITDEGKEASKQTLEALQTINGIHKEWERGKMGLDIATFGQIWGVRGKERYIEFWESIGRIWSVVADWEDVFQMFLEETVQKVKKRLKERNAEEELGGKQRSQALGS